MPKTLTELRVFVSSPSELLTEREVIIQAIDQLSKELVGTVGVILRPLTWDRDVVPGIGREPQDVIASQISDGYDIYIGLLGSYFGTPTSEAGSGTEDEFRAAYRRYQEQPANLRVLFYFKETSQNIFQINLSQFEKVKAFKEELPALGVLYSSFADAEKLYSKVLDHLRMLVRHQWAGSSWKVLSLAPTTDPSASVAVESTLGISDLTRIDLLAEDTDAAEEDGFFELIDSAMDAASEITATLESMTGDSEMFGNAIQVRAAEIEQAATTNQSRFQAKVYDLLAEDFIAYERTLRVKVPQLDSSLNKTLKSLERLNSLISSEVPQGREALRQVLPSFRTMTQSVRAGKEVMIAFQDKIRSAPPMTKHLRSAKRKLIDAMETLVVTVTVFAAKSSTLTTEIEVGLGSVRSTDGDAVSSTTIEG